MKRVVPDVSNQVPQQPTAWEWTIEGWPVKSGYKLIRMLCQSWLKILSTSAASVMRIVVALKRMLSQVNERFLL